MPAHVRILYLMIAFHSYAWRSCRWHAPGLVHDEDLEVAMAPLQNIKAKILGLTISIGFCNKLKTNRMPGLSPSPEDERRSFTYPFIFCSHPGQHCTWSCKDCNHLQMYDVRYIWANRSNINKNARKWCWVAGSKSLLIVEAQLKLCKGKAHKDGHETSWGDNDLCWKRRHEGGTLSLARTSGALGMERGCSTESMVLICAYIVRKRRFVGYCHA